MAVDYIRVLACLEQEFQHCTAEKTKSLRVILMAIINTPVKKVFIGVGINKKTLSPMYKAKVHGTVKPLLIIGHPQIIHHFMKLIDLVMPHAVILWQNYLYIMSANLQLTAQPIHHIAKPSNLCYWRTLRSYLCNIHDLLKLLIFFIFLLKRIPTMLNPVQAAGSRLYWI